MGNQSHWLQPHGPPGLAWPRVSTLSAGTAWYPFPNRATAPFRMPMPHADAAMPEMMKKLPSPDQTGNPTTWSPNPNNPKPMARRRKKYYDTGLPAPVLGLHTIVHFLPPIHHSTRTRVLAPTCTCHTSPIHTLTLYFTRRRARHTQWGVFLLYPLLIVSLRRQLTTW